MTIDDFKQIPYKIIDENKYFKLFLWTDEKIINIFKEVNKYTVDYRTSFYKSNFVFFEIKNECLNYITFNACETNTIIDYKGDKHIFVLNIYNKLNDCFVIAYFDIMKYTKDIIEKYKVSDEILKHLIEPSKIITFY